MPYAHVNGQQLCYEDSGGDGPPVILSHGFLLDHRMFEALMADLSDVYRVITWDQRGFGETKFGGGSFTLWDSAQDLFGLLDSLGIERAVLGGMTLGGQVSLRAALLHPDRVRALALIDAQAPPETPENRARYRALIQSWVSEGDTHDLASDVAELILGGAEVEPAWRARWQNLEPSRVSTAAEALLERDDITDRLPELAMPVLLLHGSRDASIPIDRALEICSAVDDCRGVVEVPGAGQASPLTHPRLVEPALRDFLEGLPA